MCLAFLFLMMGWSIVDPILPLEYRGAVFGVALFGVIGLGVAAGGEKPRVNTAQPQPKKD